MCIRKFDRNKVVCFSDDEKVRKGLSLPQFSKQIATFAMSVCNKAVGNITEEI
jgi:hypothetical protein